MIGKKYIFIKNSLFENTSNRQIILKNTFWLFLTEGINKGLIFFLMILIARYLGVEGYGGFSFSISFAALFIIIADLGLTTLTVRDVAKNKKLTKKYLENIYTIKFVLCFIYFFFINIFIKLMNKSQEVEVLVFLFSIFFILNSFNEFLRSIFRAYEEFHFECISKVIQGTILFGMGFFLLIINSNIFFIVLSYIIASLISFITTIFLIIKNFTNFNIKFNLKEWNFLLKRGITIGLASFSILLFNHVDKVMLGAMLDSNLDVGYYNASYKILEIVIFMAIIFSQAIFPRLSALSTKSIKSFNGFISKIKYIYFIVPVLIFIFIFIMSNNIINILYGDSYQRSSLILKWLSFTIFPIFLNNLYGNILIITDRQKIYFYGTFLGLFGNVIFNIYFIPTYGAIGASVATFISEFVSLIIFIFYLKGFLIRKV